MANATQRHGGFERRTRQRRGLDFEPQMGSMALSQQTHPSLLVMALIQCFVARGGIGPQRLWPR